MAIRYRTRRATTGASWNEPLRLRGVGHRIRRWQRADGPPYRFRRKDEQWGRWWRRRVAFRLRALARLRRGRVGIFQVQTGGEDGANHGVLKYRVPPPEPTPGERVIAAAKTQIGVPYDFGEANGPEDPGKDEFDCSGFTQWAWATEGVWLPHQAELQRVASNVDRFESESQAAPGDLVFMWFPNSRGIPSSKASHVGLWLERGTVIDTRSTSSPVAVRPSAGVIGYGRPVPSGQQ